MKKNDCLKQVATAGMHSGWLVVGENKEEESHEKNDGSFIRAIVVSDGHK